MKRRSRFFGIFFGVLILLLTATMGFGATWYVANDGNNGGLGTESDPFETIQYAVSSADHGDTVRVEAGTYSGDISIDSDGIILESVAGAERTTIDGGISNNAILVTGNGVTIEGFDIKNASFGIKISAVQTADVTISSNTITDMTSEGIYLTNAIQGCSVTINDNTITSCDYGIDLGGNMGENDEPVDIRIVDNTITNSTSEGIYFYYLYSGTVEISGNILTDCTDYAIEIAETGCDGKEVSFKVQKNTITLSGDNTGDTAIYMYRAERTTWITGNTISGDYDCGIDVEYVGNIGAESVLFYVEDNVITGSDEGIHFYDVFRSTDGNVYVKNNTISKAEDYGVYLDCLSLSSNTEGFTFTFEDNIIFDCDYGLYLRYLFESAPGTVYIRHNSFVENNMGLYIGSIYNFDDSTLVIEDNNFEDNSDYGLYNSDSVLIDATNNWWGDETGPYDGRLDPQNPDYNNLEGLGDEVSDYVDYDGWRETLYTGGADSSGGCAVGGFSPAMLLLALPLAGLFCRK